MSNFRLCSALPLLIAALPIVALAPAAGRAASQPPVHLLAKANTLPLAIDPSVEIRKTKTYFLETPAVTGIRGDANRQGQEQSLVFERRHLLYGAVTASEIRDRYGNYFTFFWRTKRTANLTVRLEYRQAKVGGFVQAREVEYPSARGSYATRFSITGDDYLEQGRVSAWRLLVIEDHRAIVALSQSFLWR